MRFARKILGVAAFAVMLPASVMAATFSGEFWDSTTLVNSLSAADAIVANQAVTATFTSQLIDYPNGIYNVDTGDSTSLAAFLGVDAASLSGGGERTLDQSVFRFTGYLDLLNGNNLFTVGSDDGFRLTVGGQVLATANDRGFAYSNVTGSFSGGLTPFELMYYENGGSTGVEFKLNGLLATAASVPSAVPLPAALPLLLVALGGLGLARRRR